MYTIDFRVWKPEQIGNFSYLRQTEVDGHGFGDVKESSVGRESEGEPVEALKDVGALMGLEDVHGHPGHRARPHVGAWGKKKNGQGGGKVRDTLNLEIMKKESNEIKTNNCITPTRNSQKR